MLRLVLAAALTVFMLPASADEAVAEAAIKAFVPTAKIDSIAESAVPGFYQVVLQGQVVYVSQDGKYLFQGSLFDMPNKTDLTENVRTQIRGKALAAVGQERRIIFAAKDPKHKVTVFTDVDCGYCRRLHSEMAEYNKRGITIEYLFYPRAGVGSASWDKAVSVWCAVDRNAAMTAAQNGDALEKKTCDNPVAQDFELVKQIGVGFTPSVYTTEGVSLGGYMTPDSMLARLSGDGAP